MEEWKLKWAGVSKGERKKESKYGRTEWKE
jgi:hypothetical protein